MQMHYQYIKVLSRLKEQPSGEKLKEAQAGNDTYGRCARHAVIK